MYVCMYVCIYMIIKSNTSIQLYLYMKKRDQRGEPDKLMLMHQTRSEVGIHLCSVHQLPIRLKLTIPAQQTPSSTFFFFLCFELCFWNIYEACIDYSIYNASLTSNEG